MLYDIGASWNPDMSQYNRKLKRNLAGVKGLDFAYRLNQWGPKVGPPMIPANLASPLTWVQSLLGLESTSDLLDSAAQIISDNLNKLPSTLTLLQSYLSQVQAYDKNSNPVMSSRAQALQSQASGLAGATNNWTTMGTQLAGKVYSAKTDPNTTKDEASDLKAQAQSYSDQIDAMNSQIKELGSDVAKFLDDAGASPSIVQAIQNSVLGSVSTLTWIVGGSLAAYFLLPTFLPRLAGGIKKSIRA